MDGGISSRVMPRQSCRLLDEWSCSSQGVNFRKFINLSSPFTNRLVHLQIDWLIRKYAAHLQMDCIFAYGLK